MNRHQIIPFPTQPVSAPTEIGDMPKRRTLPKCDKNFKPSHLRDQNQPAVFGHLSGKHTVCIIDDDNLRIGARSIGKIFNCGVLYKPRKIS